MIRLFVVFAGGSADEDGGVLVGKLASPLGSQPEDQAAAVKLLTALKTAGLLIAVTCVIDEMNP